MNLLREKFAASFRLGIHDLYAPIQCIDVLSALSVGTVPIRADFVQMESHLRRRRRACPGNPEFRGAAPRQRVVQ
jgi:hypothetical protein